MFYSAYFPNGSLATDVPDQRPPLLNTMASLGKRKRVNTDVGEEYGIKGSAQHFSNTSPSRSNHHAHHHDNNSTRPPPLKITRRLLHHASRRTPPFSATQLPSTLAQQRPSLLRPTHSSPASATLSTPRPETYLSSTPIITTTSTAPTATPTSTAPILAPCHICHKAPQRRKDLDAYADCSRCRARTCYICLRRCEGQQQQQQSQHSGGQNGTTPHFMAMTEEAEGEEGAGGCGARRICSACCVERGEGGVVSCLDCLEAEPK